MKQKRKSKYSAKRKLRLQDILNFNGSIRIPVSESVPLAEEVRMIIDTQGFQRLRGVRQLGPTHFIYPGAIHTRFEHSLGTYALSLRYVEALLAQEDFYNFSQNAADMSKLLIASALLHDIGHYPFSHLIEEIGPLPGVSLKRHEERAESLILNSEIRSVIEEHWKINPHDVCRAIKGSGLQDGFAVIDSALSGVLDLDKMDYLIRDSVHCGVNFGFALDIGRFLAGLRIDIKNSCICLNTKAESYIPTLITVRNLMYNEVYWHKTVRASGAMIKTLIYRLSELNVFKENELTQLLSSQDDRFAFRLSELAKTANKGRLSPLAAPFIFKGRGLFKMIYVFGMSVANGKPNAKRFFSDNLLRDQIPPSEYLMQAKSLETAIRAFRPKLEAGDILLESTPVKLGHETFDLENMRLLDERIGKFVKPSYDLGAADDLLDNSRRVFVFCHPDRADICRNLKKKEWEIIFHRATLGLHKLNRARKKGKRERNPSLTHGA